jgi:hypothetical protein
MPTDPPAVPPTVKPPPTQKQALIGLFILAWIVVAVVLAIVHGTGATDGAQSRRAGENFGLAPPACINQQPLRCEQEKGEATREEEGAKEAEAAQEGAKRASEETGAAAEGAPSGGP